MTPTLSYKNWSPNTEVVEECLSPLPVQRLLDLLNDTTTQLMEGMNYRLYGIGFILFLLSRKRIWQLMVIPQKVIFYRRWNCLDACLPE